MSHDLATAPSPTPPQPVADRRARLVVASFLMLFTELVLIRWSAAQVVYLALFTNFILLASFLGIGLGFLRGPSAPDRFRWVPVAVVAYAGFILLFPVHVTRVADQRSFSGLLRVLPALPQWVILPILFVGAAGVMYLITQRVARLFVTFPPLEAYRLDVLGSIAGIAAFSVGSFLRAGPWLWGLVIVAALWWLERPRTGWDRAALGAVAAVTIATALFPGEHWSPYYKVSARPSADGERLDVAVNNIPHQAMRSVATLEDVPGAPYFFPYARIGDASPERVLIVGAGTGNDVAIALSRAARSVDAVEIDPVLQRLGRDHPDGPYADDRVAVHIDDGRAFLQRTDRAYDLILFALPDSLTAVSQSSLRLESFLFTREAIGEVRDHLRPGGAFSMYNFYRPDVFDRFAGTIRDVFGHPPCVDLGATRGVRRQAVLTVGLEPDDVRCAETWEPITGEQAAVSDDHPFPYLRGRAIPAPYLWALGLIVLGSLAAVRVVAGPLRRMGAYGDLFFMGVAFLLLETKSIVGFALLFGTTWLVNALVFAGILLSVLAAVELARRVRLPPPWLMYAGLGLAVLLAWVIPPSALLELPVAVRFAAATGLAFAPIFLANLVFAQRFRDVGSSTVAFGANLLGAMLGGVLEYAALLVGYRHLLLLVLALYGLAFALGRRHLRAAGV